MELRIDTTEHGRLRLVLVQRSVPIYQLEKKVDGLSEHLLPELKKFLRRNRVELPALKKISVNRGPGGFSSTRTGVATANALNFALGLSDKIIHPKYDKAPNITHVRH